MLTLKHFNIRFTTINKYNFIVVYYNAVYTKILYNYLFSVVRLER